MRELLSTTGFAHSYWIHWPGGLFAVQLPHMSGGSGFGLTMPSLRDLIQYWTGIGSFEAEACAAVAMLRLGSGGGCGSWVCLTLSMRAGKTVSSHCTVSMATLRRKWPPPLASAVW